MDGRGCFITFEGGEGVGKSTQIRKLGEHLRGLGYEVVELREPGSTSISEQIRLLLLDKGNSEMAPLCELMLYEAARAQLVSQVIEPALEQGKVVLCDRFNDSTMAYQGYARGLGCQTVKSVDDVACNGLAPDRTILMEKDTAAALELATVSGADRIESESLDFHRKVHSAFDEIADANPQRVRRVAMNEDAEVTFGLVWQQVKDLFGEGE